jgi:hypothetical protein
MVMATFGLQGVEGDHGLLVYSLVRQAVIWEAIAGLRQLLVYTVKMRFYGDDVKESLL